MEVFVPMNERYAGKNVIVTGSGTGIGREVALQFAREGANVVLHYAHSSAGAESAVEEIKKMGRKATAIKANFGDVEDVKRFGREAIAFLGKVDALVNNAGITFNKPYYEVTVEQFDMMYNVNIKAQYFLGQVIAEHMEKNGGGAILNVTSIHGVSGAPEHSVYAGTKGAIIAFTRSIAVEMAHKGVRFNALAPGSVQVENYYKACPGYDPEASQKAMADMIPCGYQGVPSDMATVATFLCSEEARFIVGQTIVADGGTTALMSLIRDFRHRSDCAFGADYLPGVKPVERK